MVLNLWRKADRICAMRPIAIATVLQHGKPLIQSPQREIRGFAWFLIRENRRSRGPIVLVVISLAKAQKFAVLSAASENLKAHRQSVSPKSPPYSSARVLRGRRRRVSFERHWPMPEVLPMMTKSHSHQKVLLSALSDKTSLSRAGWFRSLAV